MQELNKKETWKPFHPQRQARPGKHGKTMKTVFMLYRVGQHEAHLEKADAMK